MVDLEKLGVVDAAERGAPMDLKGPAGDATDAKITVMGFDAEPVVQAARAFDRAEAKRDTKEREADDTGPMQRRNIALAKAAIMDPVTELAIGGKALDADGLRKLLDDPNYVWIVTQVCTFGGARRNFFPVNSAD